MARQKQVARKSTGGKGPGKQLGTKAATKECQVPMLAARIDRGLRQMRANFNASDLTSTRLANKAMTAASLKR